MINMNTSTHTHTHTHTHKGAGPEEVQQGHRVTQSSYHVGKMCVWGSRFVAVPTYFYFKTSVIIFIVTNKSARPLYPSAVSCHNIHDLCQKVRYIAAHSQDFGGLFKLTFS